MPRPSSPGFPVKLLNYMSARRPVVAAAGSAKCVTDGVNGTATARTTFTIGGVNDAPVAIGIGFTMNEDDVLNGNLGFLPLDVDNSGNELTFMIPLTPGSLPENGDVTLQPNGNFVYTPDPDFFGVDQFTYTVSDGNGGTDTATVTVTVNGIL